MRLTGLLAGIGIASIAIFSKNTVESALSLAREIHKEGFTTTASAKVSTSEISFQTTSIPLPPKFWQDAVVISAPPLFEEPPVTQPLIVTSLYQNHSPNPEAPISQALPPTPVPTPAPIPTPPPSPSPEPTPVVTKPEFDAKALKKALHEKLASVFTGDLPYILLKSGDRLYAGSKLTEGVTLEAISPTAILCTTPVGILKIESKPDAEVLDVDANGVKSPLPLDPVEEYASPAAANSL